MCLAPLLHAPGLLGSAEVIPVWGLAQPPALAGGFAGPPTLKLRTVTLVITVAVIRTEKLAAMTALTSAGFGIHCEQNPMRQSVRIKPKQEPARSDFLCRQHFFTEHVHDLDGDRGFALGRGEFVLACDEVGFLLRHIGEGDVEDLAVVGWLRRFVGLHAGQRGRGDATEAVLSARNFPRNRCEIFAVWHHEQACAVAPAFPHSADVTLLGCIDSVPAILSLVFDDEAIAVFE